VADWPLAVRCYGSRENIQYRTMGGDEHNVTLIRKYGGKVRRLLPRKRGRPPMPEPMSEEERKAAEARFIRGSTDKSKPMTGDRLFFLTEMAIADFDERALELIAEVERLGEESNSFRVIIHQMVHERGQVCHLKEMEELAKEIYPELREPPDA